MSQKSLKKNQKKKLIQQKQQDLMSYFQKNKKNNELKKFFNFFGFISETIGIICIVMCKKFVKTKSKIFVALSWVFK